MINTENALLIVIDVQGRLAELAFNKDETFQNIKRLIRGANLLHVPVLYTQQYPEGLGPTIPELMDLLADIEPINKRTFSCWGEPAFVDQMRDLDRNVVLLTGIEAHVCVYMTARDLCSAGYNVQVVSDAVSSRTGERKKVGIGKMREMGVSVTSTETVLFELLQTSDRREFKEMLGIIK